MPQIGFIDSLKGEPVYAGDKIGELIAEKDGDVLLRAPIVAKNKVTKTQFLGRVIKNIKVMLGGE